MKISIFSLSTTLTLGVISLFNLANAHPINGHGSNPNSLVKRDGTTNKIYKEVIVSEQVVIFVNQDGTPVSTSTMPLTQTTITHTTTSSTSSTSTTSPEADPTTKAVASDSAVKAVAAATVQTTSDSDATKDAGYGFSYSPYMASGACKSANQVATDFAGISDIEQYSIVRIYGTDCNQVATVLPAAKAHGLKIFAGVFDINQLDSEVSAIISAAKGDWSSFDTVSVGNELVNSGVASPSAVVAAIGSARSKLKAAGFTGSVVTVDTLVATRTNPSLCDESDYCAVNCHPFFDADTKADGSGDFLTTQISTLRKTLSNKNQRILIAETGWPWQGLTNGQAIPSKSNQATAISSIKSAFASNPKDVVLFTAFNDLWKVDSAYTFNADQFWGFVGYAPSG